MTFHGLAEEILKNSQTPLTANEIWAIALEKGLDKQLNSSGKTPAATLGARIYVLSKEAHTVFDYVGKRPKRFILKNKKYTELEKYESGDSSNTKIQKEKKFDYLEKDLHPFLTWFAKWKMDGCLTKTIIHNKSSRQKYAEWVHPDMVGCTFTNFNWEKSVTELNKALGSPTVKIISYEIKRRLDFDNLREFFFQAVSNSSWANEAYLVTSEFEEDEDFYIELSRLSNSFGIGVIYLDLQEPELSEIRYPARTRELIDWEMVNKLTMNPDFKGFLERIEKDLKINETTLSWYDHVPKDEDLKAISKTKISYT
jgi:hypothetical protein